MISLEQEIEQERALLEALRTEHSAAVIRLERLKLEDSKRAKGAERRVADIDAEIERHQEVLADLAAQAKANALAELEGPPDDDSSTNAAEGGSASTRKTRSSPGCTPRTARRRRRHVTCTRKLPMRRQRSRSAGMSTASRSRA